MHIYAIVGAGGFGREVMPVAREMLAQRSTEPYRLVFVDDGDITGPVNGHDVLTTEAFFALDASQRYFNVAIGSGATRELVAQRMIDKGAQPFQIRALAQSVVLDGNQIGEGAVLCPFTTITSNAKIGRFFQSNIYSYVAHDCEIGDFVTFAPGVKCNGSVRIEDHAYIGTGAVIKQGTPQRPIVIGKGAIVGMGAVVNKSVAPGETVVGNPAKPLRKLGAGS
ncbi:acetyltransferase [Pseudomonas fakonensis]|uniref:Acetyltransferase n=1 Tax=Pseudomonas fakonensis TaxID=2842355 RepID=A0ABX8NBV0_9PSED|nr:acetyltransferase [Pseudomonas fakonensis]QXH52908.1 acetyltransferase [Pseudomonas fakonensis]